jgi:putative transposase
MNGRRFSPEFKLSIVRQLESGEKRPSQICREHHLAHNQLTNWRREYSSRGEAAFSPVVPSTQTEVLEARIAELERFCGKLALENDVLKKALRLLPSKSDTN